MNLFKPKQPDRAFLEIFQLFDKESIEKIKLIIGAIDPEKIKQIFDSVEITNEEINIVINLKLLR